jgi:uncharacterized protein YyaL (SSP411 family)
LDLYEADFNPEWLTWATELTEEMTKRFYDADRGGYYMTAADQDASLILRIKEDSDNVEPAASSVAALNLLRLSQLLDRSDFEEIAKKTLKAFGTTLKETPRALPYMLAALDFSLTEPRQIVFAGDQKSLETRKLLKILHETYIPVKTVIWAGLDAPQKPIDGKVAAYVCIRHTCKQPTADLAIFANLLKTL